MNEVPERDRVKPPRLDGRASRFGALRWIPLIVAILIMIVFAVLIVIGSESSRPIGKLPGTPRRAPQSHFNPVDPHQNGNANQPRLLQALCLGSAAAQNCWRPFSA